MNLAYYRKSNFSKEETIKNVKELAEKEGYTVLGEVELPKASATLINICREDWVTRVLKNDKNLVGLLPCSILVAEIEEDIAVGVGNPAVLGGVSQNHDIQHLAADADSKLKDFVNEVTGAGPLKPTHVTLYSSTTCPYCMMEKQWLEQNKIEHELILVDKDPEAAQQMVKETGQMGVPVTAIEYDEGEKEFIVGFDKVRLGSILLSD